jgi:hypothetical protein
MAFKSDKQRRWMHLHHPEIAKDWEKKYKDGGFVEDSKEANKEGDVVDAKLSPGELILNGKHLAKVEEMTGVPAEQFWAEVGVPGFEGGQNPMEARGGGVSKRDYLMKYQDSGVAPLDISGMIEKKTGTKDYDEQQQMLGNMGKFGDPGAFTITPTEVENLYQSNPAAQQNFAADMTRLEKEKSGGFFQNLFAGKNKNTDLYASKAGGGVAKKEYLAGYKHGGVEHGDGSDILDIIRNISQRERFSKERPGVGELTYKPQREYYTKAAEMAIEDFDWDKKAKKYRYGGAAKKTKKKKQLMSYY